MNLTKRLNILKIVLIFIILFILLFPFYFINFSFPIYSIGGIIVDLKNIIGGIFFVIFVLLTISGDLILKNDKKDIGFHSLLIDKIMLNALLITFVYYGYLSVFIPLVCLLSDEIIHYLRFVGLEKGKYLSINLTSKIGKYALLTGVGLMFFYNLPFEIVNIHLDVFLIYFGMIMSIINVFEYYVLVKKIK